MIVVTGAAGFIGFQTAKRLLAEGHSVILVDSLPFFDQRPEHAELQNQKKVIGRLSPLELIAKKSAIDFAKVDGIIHMGACSDTTEMRVDYLNEVNLEYSKTLWNIATEYKIPFVYASSAATYGAGEFGYEDDESKMALLKPLNPYGNSKLQFDLWVLEQEKVGNTPPIWSGFKFFNVYGFGERHKVKMASVVFQGFEQIRAHGKLKLFKSHKPGISDGEQKRDFVYVGDVVDVMMFALGLTKQGNLKRGIYNLGSGKARSFLDLAKATFRSLGKTENIEFIDTPVEIRDRYQYFTEAVMLKLRNAGYTREFTTLEDGVQQTIADLQRFTD
jgi:ADP-L-glycero-D-manno-heptose 6-epimerase